MINLEVWRIFSTKPIFRHKLEAFSPPIHIVLKRQKGVVLLEIPISGFMYHSDNSDSMHSHQLFITQWDGRPVPAHVHEFRGVTSFEIGHNHRYAGTTEPAPSGVPHTHRYFTFTSVNDQHRHEIRGVTGPAIPLTNGGHYHEFSGFTTVDSATTTPPHRHSYSGRTSFS